MSILLLIICVQEVSFTYIERTTTLPTTTTTTTSYNHKQQHHHNHHKQQHHHNYHKLSYSKPGISKYLHSCLEYATMLKSQSVWQLFDCARRLILYCTIRMTWPITG